MSGLSGLRAVVTGGASGIGLATAHSLAAQGAAVAVLDLDPGGVSEPLLGLRADVSDDASVRAAVEQAVERLGGLDIVVNNAGIGAVGTIEDNMRIGAHAGQQLQLADGSVREHLAHPLLLGGDDSRGGWHQGDPLDR